MSVVQITPTTSLHDLNRDLASFGANIQLQSQDGDFLFAVATQTEVDNDVVKFQKSQSGRAAFSYQSTSPKFVNHYIALKSAGAPANLQAQMIVQLTPTAPPQVAAAVETAPMHASGRQVMSVGVWIILLIVVVMVMRKRK